MSDLVTLSNGKSYSVPGFSALTPDQQEQRKAQIERDVRVKSTADTLNTRDRERRETGMFSGMGAAGDMIRETGDEFARNMTGGLSELAQAGASYINFGPDEEDPFNDLDFWERRDAIEMAQDQEAEEYLPPWLDNTASVLGVLGLGGPAASAPGLMNTVKGGATVGAIEGLGNSDAQSLPELAGDVALNTGLGAGVGGLSDIFLSKIVGGAARKVFADENSAEAFDALETLGIPPSVGAIGNRTAGTLENAFAESPVSGVLGRGMDAARVVPGTSSSLKQQMQVEALDRALGDKVTSQMVRPGEVVAQTDSAVGPYIRDVAKTGLERGRAEMRGLETDFAATVPPGTPVNIGNTRDAPEAFRRGGESERLASAAQGEVDTILKNPRQPVNTAKDATLNSNLSKIDADIARAEGQISALPPGSPQSAKLRTTVAKLNQKKQATLKEIDANKGPKWSALRQERSIIGRNTDPESFAKLSTRDDNALYAAISRDLERAAARVAGPRGVKKFRDMTKREREIFASAELIKPMATTQGAASNVPALKAALVKGNDAELDALLSQVKPEEMGLFRANALHMLGRNAKDDPFVPSQFHGNWQRMTDEAKNKLVPDPGQRALVDAIANVSESFTSRGMSSNRSNSASAAGVMAFLGASVASPDKILPFLVTAGGVDRVVASRALAEAVAGRPTQLGQLVRRAAYRSATSGDAMDIIFGQEQP